MKYYCHYESIIGPLWLGEEDGVLRLLVFAEQDPRLHGYTRCQTPFLEKVSKQLNEYFSGTRTSFSLPLALHGTEFQQRVWKELQSIAYGTTCSYQDIALRIGSPKASRAVGLANNRNPISIIIPCHRVLSQDGKLTGYAGGLEAKAQLIDLEQRYA